MDVTQEVNTAAQFELAVFQQLAEAMKVVLAKFVSQQIRVGQVRLASATMLRMPSNFPATTIDCRSGSGYQGVQVRMMLQLLVSGVQHHQRRRVEFSGATKFAIEGLPSTLEQQVVKCLAVAQDQR